MTAKHRTVLWRGFPLAGTYPPTACGPYTLAQHPCGRGRGGEKPDPRRLRRERGCRCAEEAVRPADSPIRRGHPRPELRECCPARPAGGRSSAGRGLPPSGGRARARRGAALPYPPFSPSEVAERGGKQAPGARLPPAGRSHAELREGEGDCGLGRPTVSAVAVPADVAALQPGHPVPAALPGGQWDLLRVLGSSPQPRRRAVVSLWPGCPHGDPFCPSRLLPARPVAAAHAAVSAPQARGRRPPGQLARQRLCSQPRGHFPVPDREEPRRAVRAAPAG